MSEEKGYQDLLARLEQELDKERKGNKNLAMVGIGFIVVVGGYILWLSWALGTMLDPTNLAEATAGLAIDSAPAVQQHLRSLVVEGAPELARTASNAAIDLVPGYRTVLEEEMKPVVDEVAEVVANTAVKKMVESGGEATEGQVLQEAADAAVARLGTVLDEALDAPIEEDGRTPRQMIEGSLEHLVIIDRGLANMARGKGDGSERELVLAWLNVVQQQQEAADIVAAENYKQTGATP